MKDEVSETVDELRRHGLRVIQRRDGYRFSLDPLLLCDFAGVRAGDRVADLGTGCGVIPMVLARKADGVKVVGVEAQEEMADLARRNLLLNGLEERITILHEDVVNLKKRCLVSSFDLVVSNPPYRRRGTGRVSPKSGRDAARHESTAGLLDFLAAAKYLVKPTGRICFIYHPIRLPELFAEAARLKLAPMRLRMVHGTAAAGARMVLVEFVMGRRGDLVVLPPLIVYADGGEYTEELKGILGL